MNTLVLGAAGFIGLNIVDALRSHGLEPICGRRKRENVIPLRSRKARMVIAELEEPETLEAAMEDVDLVIHAAGYYPKLSLDLAGAIAIGKRHLTNALNAAVKSKVQRFLYVSTTATVAPNPKGPSTEIHTFDAPPGFGTYHDLKWEMEAQALGEDRLSTSVLCPAGCIGPWDLRVGTSAIVVGTANGLNPPHPDGTVSIVDARDVGDSVALLAQISVPPKRLLLSGGSYPLQDLLQDLAARYGVAEPSKPLPAEEAKAFATREEEKCEKDGGRPPISREIVDLIVHGVQIDASLAASVLGHTWRTLPDTLDAFDEWARRMRIIVGPPSLSPELSR